MRNNTTMMSAAALCLIGLTLMIPLASASVPNSTVKFTVYLGPGPGEPNVAGATVQLCYSADNISFTCKSRNTDVNGIAKFGSVPIADNFLVWSAGLAPCHFAQGSYDQPRAENTTLHINVYLGGC